jgi:hypothetical protein
MCALSLTLPMGGISSLDPHDNTIRIWDANTGGAVGKPLEGHTGGELPLLTPSMGGISPLGLMTAPLRSGMLRLAL